jgi:DNA primase
VRLIPSGSNFKGLCPFHSEKTPSFTVSPQKGMYHCFGCGAGGSAIDFVMASERLSFPEAVRALAGRLGIALEEREPAGEGPRGREALAAARGYYHDLLLQRPEAESARRYLAGRGFDEDDWRAFALGFALDDWQGLIRHAQRAGFAEEDLLAAGLVRRSTSGRLYDLLRKRVTFPIADATRHCIAFGGRVLDPLEQPKYLNTPETAYYHKSRVLFGLAEGQEALRKERTALLVEGYLDVIRLHQGGFAQAVATCGVALACDEAALSPTVFTAVTT